MWTQEVGRDLSQWFIAALSELLEMKEGGVQMRRVHSNRKQQVLEDVRIVKAALVLILLFLAPEAQELHSLCGAANGPTFFGIFQLRHIWIYCDLVMVGNFLICPLLDCTCVTVCGNNDCIDQRRPHWVATFRQGRRKTLSEGGKTRGAEK